MLLARVMFDKECINWMNTMQYNYNFLRTQENYINDIIKYRGYIYLNQIYEILGINWHPDYENPCVRNDGAYRLWFVQFDVFEQSSNSLLVNIYSYN